MMDSLLKRIEINRKAHARWIAMVLCLSMLVSLGTFAGFHKTAVAKVYTNVVLDCPYAHEGAEKVAHTHNDDCYDGETLVCSLPEIEAHTHSEECYSEREVLRCTLEENPGHQHTEACYTEWEEFRCGLEENPGHQHTAACYNADGALICTIPEGEGAHTHTPECYEIVRELTCTIPEGEGAHTHTAECYETVRELICDKPELPVHVHGPECFRTEEVAVGEEEKTIPEMPVSDPNADLETASDWEQDFEGLELSGNWARDLVLVAATQQGRGESPNNFEAVLNDAGNAWVTHGYTRYGAWYGVPYAEEWSAMFVSFCLRYAGIPAENVPNNPTAAFMAESFQKGELFVGPDYIPAVGDLIFFDTVDDEITNIDHMGIVYHVDAEDGTINTVEGDRTNAVATFGYHLDDEQIVGYGMLPQNPDYVPTEENLNDETAGLIVMTTEEQTAETSAPAVPMPAQSWERTAGGIKVSVEAPEGAFPENTKIAVTPVNGNSLKDTVSDAVDGAVLEVQAVDITFFDADGHEIEPAIPIRVVMTPAATQHAEEKANVVHVDIAQQTAELIEQAEGTEADNSEVVFDADTFTIYAIVYTVDTYFRSCTGETFRVTMDFDENAGIPQNAELVVEEILEESADYSNLLSQAENALDGNKQISFVRFFDISIMADGKEVQPLASVSMKIQLADLPEETTEADAQVIHFGEQPEVLTTEAAGANVSFEANGFSVYAVVYTVDFEYEVDGQVYQFSIPGGNIITLSDLVEVLGILGNTNFGTVDEFIAAVETVEFSDPTLVKVVHPEADTTVGELVRTLGVERQLSATIGEEEALALEEEIVYKNEWTLISLKPFDTVESLTITMKNGDVLMVKVTDASSVASNDGIKSLLTDVSITGAKQEGGAYVFYPDQPYGIHLTFKEVNKENGQFPMGVSFTYQLPAGLMPSGYSVSNYLEITLSGGDHAGEKVKLNYTINDSGLITFTWDQSTNPDAYSQLADALYSQFKLDLECTYNGDGGTLDFGNQITKEVTVKNNGTVSVNKVGKYNPVTNCVDYTVSVYSDGITKNVVITDTVSGSALTYNRDAASSSSIYGKEVPSPTSNGNGFSLTIPQMADQETVTVKYSAAVNLEGLTKNPDGTWGTVTETGNKVIVNSKDNPPVEKENSGKDFENKISMSNIGKSGSSVEADETGHATVNWTIHANDNANVSMAGHTISDSISGNSAPMSYNSTGIHVVAYKADGTLAYEKNIPWGSDGLTKAADGQSWSWSVPNQDPDTQKLSYVITYTTDVDVTGRLINTEVKNHSESDNGGSSDGRSTVTPDGGALNARKKVVKTDVTSKTVTWEINFDVPATGLDSAQIIDTMPTFWENGEVKYFDSYLGNAMIVITPELAAGESYEATTSDDGRTLIIDFYKTEEEQKVTGLSATGSARKIRVQFQTEFNEEWLTAAEGHQNEANYTNHTNTGRVLLNGQTIGVNATTKVENNEPGMSKVHGAQTTYNVNGNSLPAFPYVVTLEGVTDEYFDDSGMLYVEDTFNGKYLAYYQQTQNNNTGDNDLVGFLYGAASYQDLSKGGDPIHNVKGKSTNRVVSNPSDGKILISISRDDIPLDDSDNFYPYYYVFYYLTVKDPIALEKLNTAIQQSDSGVYSLLNTVTNQKFGSTTDTAEIQIPVLDKKITSPNGQAYYNNGNWMVDFKLDVNPDALGLGDEEELTLTDDYTNLAVDYTTIKIQKVVNGNLVDTTDADGVSWNRKGNRVTYTLQNGVHYVITYKARITGEPGNDGKVHYDNTAEYFGVKKWTKGDQNISSGGSGSAPTYGITVFKHKKGAGSAPLSGAKFKLYKYTATQEQENGWENQPSNDINTETRTPVDSGWEAVKEMTTDSDGVAKTLHSDNIQRWTWYMLIEQEAPVYEGSEHYQLKDFGYVFWITDKGVADYSHYVYLNDDVVAIDNEPPIPETVDVGVTKTWTNDNGDISKRKDITVRLFADGVPYADWTDKNGNHLPARTDTVKVLPIKSDGTTDGYTWTGLKGGPVYSVVEDGVAGYTTTYSPKSSQVSNTISIKNKYIPGKTYIHVEKNWSSDIAQENRAEDITVQLKRKVSANAEIRVVGNTGTLIEYFSVPVGAIVNIDFSGRPVDSIHWTGGSRPAWELYRGDINIQNGSVTEGDLLIKGDAVSYTTEPEGHEVHITGISVEAAGLTLRFPAHYQASGESIYDLNNLGLSQTPQVTVTGGSGESYSEDVNFNNENHYYIISAANGWKIDIDRLVKEDDDGKYIYYIEEVGVNDNTETPEEAGYIVTYENNDGIGGGTGNVAQDTIKVTNSPEPGSLEVTKTVSGTDAKGTYSIAVKGSTGHYYDLDGTDRGTDPFYVSFNKDDTVTWRNLPAGTYTVEEQDASETGYTWRVTGTDEEVVVPIGDKAEAEVINIYEEAPQTGKIIVKKTFKGINGDDLTVLQNGLTVTVSGKDVGGTNNNTLELHWSDVQGEGKTIENLPLGEKYQITEKITGDDVTTVLAKYEQVTTGTDASVTSFDNVEPTAEGVTKELVNNYEKKTGSIKITKSVTVDGSPIPSDTTDEQKQLADGTYTFEIWNADGTSQITTKADGTTLIGTLQITVEKGVASPAELTVDGLAEGSYVIKESGYGNNGGVIFDTTSDGYQANLGGIVVSVSVGDTSVVNTAAFTNNYKTTEATIVKEWNTKGNAMPESIEMTLLVNGEESDPKITKTLNAGNNWTATETGLAKYLNDEEIVYSWKEGEVSHYSVSGKTESGTVTTLTNTYETYDLETSYVGKKSWSDQNNQYQTRPENITVTLQRKIDSDETWTKLELEPMWTNKNTNEWKYTFSHLPVFDDNGNVYRYQAEEEPVPGYTEEITNQTNTNYSLGEITYEDGNKRVTPDNQIIWPLNTTTDLAFVAIAPTKNGNCAVWSHRLPTPAEKAAIEKAIHRDGALPPASNRPIDYYSGTGASVYTPHGNIEVNFDSETQTVTLDFGATKVWSQFIVGQFNTSADEKYNPGTTDFTNTLVTTELEGQKIWSISGTAVPADPILTLTRTVTKTEGEGENQTTTTSMPETVKVTVKEGEGDAVTETTEPEPLQLVWLGEGMTRSFKYSGLPKYDKDGNEYTYSVTEASFKIGDVTYTVIKNNDGTFTVNSNPEEAIKFKVTQDGNNTITNTELKSFEFSKIWYQMNGDPEVWPNGKAITVILKAKTATNENVLGEDTELTFKKIQGEEWTIPDGWKKVSTEDGKKITFQTDGLEAKNENGEELTYYVVEKQIDGYTATYVNKHGGNSGAFDKGTIRNTPMSGVELPQTGGIGTALFTAVGGLMTVTAGAILTIRRKKQYS